MISAADPWRFQAHPEVWLLVVSVVAAYIYAIAVIGPRAVGPGQPIVTRRQTMWFVVAVMTLWLASDWPVHDIAEQYLYSWHMMQHMALTYFMPPMVLLATPEWLARLMIGNGRAYAVLRRLCHPVVAGLAFNGMVMVAHIPAIVNRSASGPALLHYSIHAALVTTALAMWMCVCGPIPEWHIGPGPQMIYLFTSSVVPVIPAGWLTFAEGLVYTHYNNPFRMWGISPTYDQQLAGVIMKIGGSVFLWTVITVIWFRKFTAGFDEEQSYRHATPPIPYTERETSLTFDQVAEEFQRTAAPAEPRP
jgi:putative membrane protein